MVYGKASVNMVREIVETLRQNTKDRELKSHLGTLEIVRYEITVDYSASLQELAEAGGYGHISDQVRQQISGNRFLRSTKHGRESLIIARIQFGQEILSDQANVLFHSVALRSPGIVELLHWGIQYPEQQLQFPIVALGAITQVDKTCCLVFLDGDTISSKDLLLVPYYRFWESNARFLTICPSPS